MASTQKNDITSQKTIWQRAAANTQTKPNQTEPKPQRALHDLRVLTLSVLFSFFTSSVAATTVFGEIHWQKQKDQKQKNYFKQYNTTKDFTCKISDYFTCYLSNRKKYLIYPFHNNNNMAGLNSSLLVIRHTY